MQIKIAKKQHFTSVMVAAMEKNNKTKSQKTTVKDKEKLEPLNTASGHLTRKTVKIAPQKILKVELLKT